MNHVELIVGESLRINEPLVKYIDRVYVETFEANPNKFFISKNDNNLFLFLEELIDKYQHITIFASHESFNLVGKLLCTITEDAQILQDGILAPSKVVKIKECNYLLEFDGKEIEVILATPNKPLPTLLNNFQSQKIDFSLIDMDEESCKIFLEPIAGSFEISLQFSTLIEGWVLVEAKCHKYGQMENFLKSVASLFSDKILSSHNPCEYIVKNLSRMGKKIAFAESCTGGLLASMFTKVAGASNAFDGGVVSYSNSVKSSILKVDESVLQTHGAVSEKCAMQMAQGALKATNADIAISTTGIAGPSGGSEQKPVGTVFIAIANSDGGVMSERLNLSGDREYIQNQSAFHAIKLLLQAHKELFF